MLSFNNFAKQYNQSKEDTVYVLHQTECQHCQDFITNDFHLINADGNKDELTLVKVNMDKPKDVKDLKKLIRISKKPRFPIIVINKGGVFKHIQRPTLRSIHNRIKKMTSGSGLQKKSLDELQNILTSSGHKKYLTPLGSSVNIAMDHAYGDKMVDLNSVFARNSVVLFKWDNCGICKRLQPHFDKLQQSHQFSKNIGFYTVDASNTPQATALISKLDTIHKMPEELIQLRGYPQLALFTGHSYPHMLAGRTVEDLRKEIKEKLLSAFVNIQSTSARSKFEEIKSKNSVVLFIDWQHTPCLNTLNRLKSAVDNIHNKLAAHEIKVYAFNIRNNPDLWASICNKYKNEFNVRLSIDSIPQIIYFFEDDKIPRLKAHVDKMSIENLEYDILKQYQSPTQHMIPSLRSEHEIEHFNKSSLSKFSGGANMAHLEKAHETLLHLTQQLNEFSQKVSNELSKLNSTIQQLKK